MRIHLIMLSLLILAGCGVDPAERNNAGNRLVADGNFDDAILAYQAAQVADPDNDLYYFNVANALTGAERIAEAENALQLVIEGGDETLIADAWYNLGNIKFDAGMIDEAIIAYREALLLDPSHDDARYNLELANSLEIPPTPTAIEMQSELNEENVDEQATPTPNPAGQVFPTPTPTPFEVIPPPGPSPENIGEEESGEESDNPSTPDPVPEGEMDVEDAEDMLEPIEANQERISTFRDNYNETGREPTDKDW